jgi:hypothetical protein
VAIHAEFRPIIFHNVDLHQAHQFIIFAIGFNMQVAGVAGDEPVIEGEFFRAAGNIVVPVIDTTRMVPVLLVQ